MIKLEDFWSTSTGPIYYLATGDRIDSDEMLKHRNDVVVAFSPLHVYDPELETCYYAIGVEIDTP